MRFAFAWHPDHVATLSAALEPDDVIFPLSQRTFAEAKRLGAPLVSPSFWEILRAVDLGVVEEAAAEAVRTAVQRGEPKADLDRPSIWHNAHEAAYAAQAAEAALKRCQPAGAIIMGGDPESLGLLGVAKQLGVPVQTLAPVPPQQIALPARPPQQLLADPDNLTVRPGEWSLVIGTGIGDWGRNIPRLRSAKRPLILVLDPVDSGEIPDLYAYCSRFDDVRIAPLWNATPHRFQERGDNLEYARDIGRMLDRLIEARPAMGVVADLRRAETIVSLRKMKTAGLPVTVLAHGGAPMNEPYRFSREELAGANLEVWTATAARNYGGARVAAPRRIRTDISRRLLRWLLRLAANRKPLRIGVVVTTAAQFSAPEHDLADLLDAFGELADGAALRNVRLLVRLRHYEDVEEVWRTAAPAGANVSFEHSGGRPMVAFARACDLLVELGSESTAFLEAAGNATPYVRIGDPHRISPRFDRETSLAPRLDPSDPWDKLGPLMEVRGKRLMLALRQYRWLIRETRPRNVSAD